MTSEPEPMKKRWLSPGAVRAGVLLLLGMFALLVALQVTAGFPWGSRVKISAKQIRATPDGLYSIKGPNLTQVLEGPISSYARLLENGRQTMTRRGSIEAVKTGEKGGYSISHKAIYLLPHEGLDPLAEGSQLIFVNPVELSRTWRAAGWLAFYLAFFGCIGLAAFHIVQAKEAREQTASARAEGGHRAVVRKQGVDVLRGVAIALVVGFRHSIPCPKEVSVVMHHVTSFLTVSGWIGVDLFFVVSGFLVSGLLFNEFARTGTVRVGRFLMRRGCKIYPGHWMMIAISVVIATFTGGKDYTGDAVIGEMLYLQNYVGRIWAHTWTLAVEEHFYLLLAFIVAISLSEGKAGGKSPLRWVPMLCGFFSVACLLLRVGRCLSGVDDDKPSYNFSHLRIDALMFGVFLQYLRMHKTVVFDWVSGRRALCLGLGVVLFAAVVTADALRGDFLMPLNSPWIATVGFSVNYLAAGLSLAALADMDVSAQVWPVRVLFQALAWVGQRSYAIYLWHIPWSFWVMAQWFPESSLASGSLGGWLLYFSIYVAGSLAAGMLAEKLVELPVLRWRDRHFPVR